jgi:sulfite exporter TauE/SafE
MASLPLLPVFLVGLLGSVHCVAMCGGIVGAFSMEPPARRPFPVAVVAARPALELGTAVRVAAYNTGRIASYASAGALAGGLGAGAQSLAALAGFQLAGLWLANLMLVALGLHLMHAWRGLDRLEAAGRGLWARLRPLTGVLLPLDHPAKLLALGALWGWLPCAMVYSVLLTAMLSGSAANGAALMLAFGLGTLPMLLALGAAGAGLRTVLGRPGVATGAGLLVLGFGLLGLWRAAQGVSGGWMDLLCVTPA